MSTWDVVIALTALVSGFVLGSVFGAMSEQLNAHSRREKDLRAREEQSRRHHPTRYVDEQLRNLLDETE